MTQIIAFSGKKQSGKNTCANLIIGQELTSLGIVRQIMVQKEGLYVSDIHGNPDGEGIFDVTRNSDDMRNFLAEYLDPYVRLYHFADLLKRSVCMDILGLSYKSCYGTDADKDAPTHLYWENMPGVICHELIIDVAEREQRNLRKMNASKKTPPANILFHKEGPMSGRDVLQFVGTEIFRRMYSSVWAEGTIRRIQNDKSQLAIIADCRFPDEVEAIHNANGKVIRLTRNPNPGDTHKSECALDDDRYDWGNFDAILDNENMDIITQCGVLREILIKFGLFKYNRIITNE